MTGHPEVLLRVTRLEETVAMCVECLSALAFDPKAREPSLARRLSAETMADLNLARLRDAAITEAMRRAGGVQVVAAKLLGISPRKLCYWVTQRPRLLARGRIALVQKRRTA